MKKKHAKAKNVLKKIAWFNKRPLPEVSFCYTVCHVCFLIALTQPWVLFM